MFDRITSYWQAIAEFFIRVKTQAYLTPQEGAIVDGRQHPYYQYRYRDLDGEVDLICTIFDSTHAPTIQFLRQNITDDGFREDKVRIDTFAKEEGQIYNPSTWFLTYVEQVCTIPPDNYHFFVEIDNYRGGLLQSISRVSGLNEPLMRIDVYDHDESFVRVCQRGLHRGEYPISQEHFSRHFPLST